jgi:diguanylate cyclase (GGDEF)-like protein/PAS domain S-box-containing protein
MRPKIATIVSHASTAFVVLAIGIVLSAAASYWTANQVGREARLKFETAVNDASDAVESRIHAYSDVLLGVRGLFIASDSVSRGEFRDYIDSLELNRRYPGIQGINYGQRIAAAQKQAFEAMVRNDTSLDPRGYPDFTVKPPGDRSEYVIVQYVEPMAGNEVALGLDLGGDAVRLAALVRTRDSGRITASGSIALSLDPRRHPGFAMRLPTYRKGMPLATVAQRRAAFTGMVSAAFIVIDLMRGVLNDQFLQKIHVRIHDAGFLDSPQGLQPPAAENLMFDSDRLLTAPSSQPASIDGELTGLTSMSGLEVGERRWNLYFSARQEIVAPSDRWLPYAALLGGVTISLLLFGLIRSLATTGSRAVTLANRITEDLRTSEAELAEAQRMTQELIEVLPNPIYFKGTDGRYLGVNKAWEAYFGRPRKAFLGKTVHDLYPNNPEVADRLHADDQVLWNRPGTQVYETSITTPDGRHHDTIYYKATFTRADGSIAGLIGTIIDITERKDLERRFELTFNYAAVGILHTSLDRRMLLANKRFLDMTGYSLEELQQQPTAMIIVPDDVNTDAELEQQLLEGKIDIYQSEKRYLSKHGRVISTKRTTSVARSADGTPQYYIRVIDDVTESKLNEERYRAMFENAAVGITRVDLNGVLVDVNQKFCDMLGYARTELIGKAVKDITHSDDYGQGAALRGEVTQGVMKSAIGEKRFVRKDGMVIWALRTMSIVRDDAGNPQYVISVVEDITQRKQAELRQAMEHAVTRVLAEADTPAEAITRIIQTICESLGWACGTHWRWDDKAQLLSCYETWHVEAAEVAEFIAFSRQTTNEAPAWLGEAPKTKTGGLVRRVWLDGAPVWFPDVTREPGFRRGKNAEKAGLHCAFGFPILSGAQPMGVIEFFSRNIEQPDLALLQVVRAIGSQIGQFIQRKQAEERVRHLAHYDELTGLPNRSMFNQQLARSLAQARRHAKPLAILFVDLDRFKNINDTLGHDAGDRVLKEVADRLRECLRESDTVGRLGGDEFVVLIEELPEPVQVAAVAQKILAAVAKPFILDAQEFHITASIGISTYPADSEDMQSLLKNADISMYRAKEQGKNNYQFYSAQMNVHSLERLTLESNLRRALERNEFLLHYQPKVDIGSGRITGMEALVRWQQPAKVLLPPAQFIPLAEETGLIVPIGEWVLKTACARNKSWQEQGLPPLCIAVNLSPRQFAHENLLQDVARVLDETGLDPNLLELEITESMVMRNPEFAAKLLIKLKAMGIHLAIDDFGTGYSSLNYLKRFPIDSVKIDRSFIQDIPGNSDDAAITRAIIVMAHSLRLKVIAEGVETGEQLRFLRDHECDEMQGYYFSRPLPENEFFRLLQNSAAASKPAEAISDNT